jgi:hypothetical protein
MARPRRTWIIVTGPPTITELPPTTDRHWRADFPHDGGDLEIGAALTDFVPERELRRLAVCWYRDQLAQDIYRAAARPKDSGTGEAGPMGP